MCHMMRSSCDDIDDAHVCVDVGVGVACDANVYAFDADAMRRHNLPLWWQEVLPWCWRRPCDDDANANARHGVRGDGSRPPPQRLLPVLSAAHVWVHRKRARTVSSTAPNSSGRATNWRALPKPHVRCDFKCGEGNIIALWPCLRLLNSRIDVVKKK